MEELKRLVADAQAGDQGAFARLMRRFQDMARATAYARLGNWELAEEAAQDAFVETYLRLPTLREPAAFVHWFRLIVLKRCDRLARGRRVQTVPLEGQTDPLPAGPDPESLLEQRELEVFVQEAVLRLPEEEQLAVSLFYLGGHSLEEIAALLPAPLGTVKKRLWQARQRLRGRMVGQVREYFQDWPPEQDRSPSPLVQSMLFFYSLGQDHRPRFHTASLDGSGLKRLPSVETAEHLDFSPDGKHLIYLAGRTEGGAFVGQHHLARPDGSDSRAIGPDWVSNGNRVSPDGKWITFVAQKDHPRLFPEYNRCELYVMDADGANLLRLTHNQVSDDHPTWTPDGKILFSRDLSGYCQVFKLMVINPDGTGETGFPAGGPECFGVWPEFSPDGSRIAFALWQCRQWDLWVMDADGANQRQLTSLGGIHAPPRWSPDGQKITFAASHQLYVINADGSSGLRPEPIRFEQPMKGVNGPAWVPAAG
jgi:RNA polymerase sigma factor (sigma-70 family)